MNFNDTVASVELVLATGEVPLVVGESGIGKTALAKHLGDKNNWSIIVIDGNLLKEGEIGGLPTIETYVGKREDGHRIERKITVYAIHNKLKEIDDEVEKGNTVLLFIDEINRCEHTVQQELMNLILNREINGYRLDKKVRIMAAMNPSGKYGSDYDYQVVDMDPAQENRFVWLYMEPDPFQWIEWAQGAILEQKVIEFIATYPEYLISKKGDDIHATPRSYERISKAYGIYKESTSISRAVFVNVLEGNVGKLIAAEFINFVEADYRPLISYEEVFAQAFLSPDLANRVREESHTRLYITAKNILNRMEADIHNNEGESLIDRMIEFLTLYPVDLRIGIMKDIRSGYAPIYKLAIDNENFVTMYFEAMLP